MSGVEIDFSEFKEISCRARIDWEYIADEDKNIFQEKISAYLNSTAHNIIVWKKRPRAKKIFPHPQKEQFGYGDVVVPFTCVLCAIMWPPHSAIPERK